MRSRKKIIFDNDGSSDDFIALIRLLVDSMVSIAAITIPGTGEVHGKAGATNVANICEMFGQPDIPIAFSQDQSCNNSGNSFPAIFRNAMDKLLDGKNVPNNPKPNIFNNDKQHNINFAVELIKKTLIESNEPITILATGPLTNIANFIHDYPALKNKIDNIVIMGGAVNVPGNIQGADTTSTNTTAEWNIYMDPKAADIVFLSGIPITLVPLDATNKIPMTQQFCDSLKNAQQSELQLCYQLINVFVDLIGMEVFLKEFYLWDPLAAMICLDPTIAMIEQLSIQLDISTGQTCLVAKNTPNSAVINVVTDINQPETILNRLIRDIKVNLLNKNIKTNSVNNLYKLATSDIHERIPVKTNSLKKKKPLHLTRSNNENPWAGRLRRQH